MQRLLRLLVAVLVFSSSAHAQCGTGYTQAQLNWDALEFLRTSGAYSGYVTTAMATTQKFAFGTEYVTITHNFAGTTNGGVSTAHTGETGSFGSGADLSFTSNGSITFTFQTPVQNVKFSMYDIDVSQRVTFGATNSGVAQTINLATLGSSVLTISNNNATNARVDASTSAVANTSVNGAVNVTIAGPITSFTITTSATGTVSSGPAANQETGIFFVSDITACTTAAAFATNYYAVSKPWTGQPGYVLVVVNNKIYYADPATGKAKFLFQDATNTNINSLAYDPVNRIVYYTYSLTSSAATDKTVKKYDVSTGTISTFISDVTTLGFPVYQSGVESGAAAFYDGKLYLGVEGYMTGGSSGGGRKSVVWRIDIANGVATGAVQAYGVMSDGGTSAGSGNTHDWSDIGINNGVIYDFDGSAGNENSNVYNMYTGALAIYTPTSNFDPHQTAVDWTGTMYNIDSTITPFNGTNDVTVASRKFITSSTNPIAVGGSWGDAGEAFKPMGDLGDAPASYDPVANSPAVHEVSSNLRLGAAVTYEWTKNTSTLANGDADDGMPTPSIVINNSNYLTNVTVFNNTGASATVCAWVDFNLNGTFEASEGISMTVPSSSSAQTVQLFWPNPVTTLVPYSYTFVRIRVTSASNGMTTANPTGYYNDGEVEDYRVQVNAYTLPSELVAFDARKDGAAARLHWTISDEVPGSSYQLERSADGRRWEVLQLSQAIGAAPRREYNAIDARPFPEVTYYRLQLRKPGGNAVWSPVRELHWGDAGGFVLSPNPTTGNAQLDLAAPLEGPATLRIYTGAGALVLEQELRLPAGSSSHPFTLPAMLPAGTYLVELQTGSQRRSQRLVLRR